jgi:ABC-type branched-subunit amino acid transport system substrate-binding protein
VAVFRETGSNDPYFQAIRKGTIEGAEDNKMQVVLDLTVPFASKLDDIARDNMKHIVARLKETNPDLVAGAVFANGCHAFIQAAKELNYTAPSFLLSVCTSDADTYRSVLGDAGRYVTELRFGIDG